MTLQRASLLALIAVAVRATFQWNSFRPMLGLPGLDAAIYFNMLLTGFFAPAAWIAYLGAVWSNFALDRQTMTEEVVTGRLIARLWRTVKGWFRRSP